MHPFPHRYLLRLQGGPEGASRLLVEGLASLESAPPKEFDGPGDRWSPEHLFVASVTSCFLLTLRAVAWASKIAFSALDVDSEGVLDRVEGGLKFTEVILRARITVPTGSDHEKVKRVLEKAEKSCLVSRSLNCAVRLEAEVVEG